MKIKRICSLLVALLLAVMPAWSLAENRTQDMSDTTAEAMTENVPQLMDAGLTLGIHSVRYPQLTGVDDAILEAEINAQILAAACIPDRLNRLAAVMSLETPFEVSWEGMLEKGVLSCAISASGPVFDGRVTQAWSCVNMDTLTGEPVTLAQLFVDEKAARDAMERILNEEIAPEMSAHLENSEVTPLPETFCVSATGIMLLYPITQLSTLSGRAGAVTLRWHELREQLLLGEGTVLRRIGAEDSVTLCDSSAEAIRACAAKGALPGIPAAIGDAVPRLLQAYRKLYDPDLYEGGRLITLEDGAFRKASIMTDALSSSVENSVAQGIRADCLCLYGLCTRQTTIEEWRAALGVPDVTLTLDADRAEAYRLVPGTSDYYTCGEYRLRLHADEDGVLQTVILTQ